MTEDRRYQGKCDWFLIFLVLSMAAFGVICVAVATYPVGSTETNVFKNIIQSSNALKQAIFFLAGIIVLYVMYNLPYTIFRHGTPIFYVAGVLFLVVVFLMSKASGVKAWLDMFMGLTIQPSEFIKLALILSYANYLANEDEPLASPGAFVYEALMLGLPAAVCLVSGEMGSVLVMIFVYIVMLFTGGVRIKRALTLAVVAVALVLVVLALAMIFNPDSYRLARIMSFVDPASASSDSVLQVTNSKIAIGSGGFSGIGAFINGSISQLNYVPEDWTDFIFATIGEAFGFRVCILILIMYFIIIVHMMRLAYFSRDKFDQMVIVGVTAMLLFHVFENIAMTTGRMPVTGIPLPFLSYGGSNMLTNIGGIGLVLNVVRNRSTVPTVNTPQLYNNRYSSRKSAWKRWKDALFNHQKGEIRR